MVQRIWSGRSLRRYQIIMILMYNKPIKDFTKKELEYVLYGSKDIIDYKLHSRSGTQMKKSEFIEGVCT